MNRLHRCALAACLLLASLVARADHPAPEAYAGLPASQYQPINAKQLLRQWRGGGDLVLAQGQRVNTRQLHSHRHANGDISLEGLDPASGLDVHLTIGKHASFGEIRGPDGHWLVTTDRHGSWHVRLPDSGISYNQCGLEHHAAPPARPPGTKTAASNSTQATDEARIDLLLIYNQALAMRYPGEILTTRLNHLVSVANQAMRNSALPINLQLVGSARFDYDNARSNLDYRNDIAATLAGNTRAGLAGLRELRNQLGADLVIGLRPHDIETRGNCGIAFFPENDPNFGVNVVSDGMSSWSLCLDDTLTHEIGHNLGAAHQPGRGGGAPDPRGAALVRPGQYNTMMSSFGTGEADRFRGLRVFSNPQVSCGGLPCGNPVNTDNAAVMRSFMAAVAAYRGNVMPPGPTVGPLPAPADSDGDGLSDWQDAFPFDASEVGDADRDGRGDNSDAFPQDAREQADFDGDGRGDNADADDDDDGSIDILDAFPFNAAESADSDGDGSGDNADAFPALAAEQRDDDGDGTGNHADRDDDNDGVPDLDPVLQDILVVSAGNNRVLRFDAYDGTPRGVEVTGDSGLLTFQSDLAFRASDNSLFYTAASAVQRLDLLNRVPLGTWVPAFSSGPASSVQLASGFPTGLAWLDNQLLVSRQGDAALAAFNGQGLARYSQPAALNLDDGAAPVALTANGETAWALVRNQRSLFRISSAGVQRLAGPGLPWMRNPRRLLATDDGRLLVSDTGRNSVVALSASSGQFLGDFIDFSVLGYSGPDGLAQLADGTLLVAAADQNAVLAFAPDTGALLDVRVAPGSEGLSQPRALVAVPALRDFYSSDPQRSFRPNGGLWSNAGSDGRGLDIQVFGERLSVLWYSYDEAGLPTWQLAAGRLQGRVFDQPLLRFRRDRNGEVSNEPVGNLRLEFNGARSAQFSFSIDGVSGSEPLRWQRISKDPASPDHTGVWGRDDGPGWGLSIARQGLVSVAVAYLYDADGEPRWLLSKPVSGPSPERFEMQAAFSTGLCPSCSGARSFEFLPAGSMDISLPADSSGANGVWTSAVSWPAPLAGDWDLSAQPIRRFSAEPERPR
jgi:hypothetical protein